MEEQERRGWIVIIIVALAAVVGMTAFSHVSKDKSAAGHGEVVIEPGAKGVPGVRVNGRYWTAKDIRKEGGYAKCPADVQAAIYRKYVNDLYALHREVKAGLLRYMATTPDFQIQPRYGRYVKALADVTNAIRQLEKDYDCDPTQFESVFSNVRQSLHL